MITNTMTVNIYSHFALNRKRAFNPHVLLRMSSREIIAIARFTHVSIQRAYPVVNQVQLNPLERIILKGLARIFHIPGVKHIERGPIVGRTQPFTRFQDLHPNATRIPLVVI